VDFDPGFQFPDPCSDPDQFQPDRIELGMRQFRSLKASAPEGMQQHICRAVQKQPELVRGES